MYVLMQNFSNQNYPGSQIFSLFLLPNSRVLDKREYLMITFLISNQNHML